MLRTLSRRVIEPEVLDTLAPGHGAPNLADIVRLNRHWGGHSTLVKLLDDAVPAGESFTLLDIGAASGDMGAVIERERPHAKIISLDYRSHHLLNCPQPKIVADAFHLPFAPRSFDYVFCSLFLHHFTDEECVTLLRQFALVARKKVLINDLWRNPLPYYFMAWTGSIFDWDPVTVHDGTISVAAAFKGRELADIAKFAGLIQIRTRRHFPAFRISLSAQAL